jgi:hypothetical protein
MLTVDAAATDYIASLQARHAPVATVKAYAGDLRRFVADSDQPDQTLEVVL